MVRSEVESVADTNNSGEIAKMAESKGKAWMEMGHGSRFQGFDYRITWYLNLCRVPPQHAVAPCVGTLGGGRRRAAGADVRERRALDWMGNVVY